MSPLNNRGYVEHEQAGDPFLCPPAAKSASKMQCRLVCGPFGHDDTCYVRNTTSPKVSGGEMGIASYESSSATARRRLKAMPRQNVFNAFRAFPR